MEKMIQAALGQIEGVLDSKSVVGEPITVGDYTIVPLISIGFGFGVGSGAGKSEEFIKAHGGRIAVQSEVGTGTRFTIEFPMRPRIES